MPDRLDRTSEHDTPHGTIFLVVDDAEITPTTLLGRVRRLRRRGVPAGTQLLMHPRDATALAAENLAEGARIAIEDLVVEQLAPQERWTTDRRRPVEPQLRWPVDDVGDPLAAPMPGTLNIGYRFRIRNGYDDNEYGDVTQVHMGGLTAAAAQAAVEVAVQTVTHRFREALLTQLRGEVERAREEALQHRANVLGQRQADVENMTDLTGWRVQFGQQVFAGHTPTFVAIDEQRRPPPTTLHEVLAP